MKPKNRKLFKRFSILIGTFIAIFTMSSCTKSFCSNLDKANQMYAQYGNIYQFKDSSTDVSDISKDNSVQADNTEIQNENRKNLFNTLTGITSVNYSYTFPSDEFLTFMNNKVNDFVNTYYTVFLDGTIASFQNSENETAESKARLMAKHVAIYAGFDFKDDVESLSNVLSVSYTFKNMDSWYALSLADSTVGLAKAPNSNFMNDLKNSLSSATGVTTCITPESSTFQMNNTPIYIEGKTWGQAFQQYGFLEGLFVYPFAYIIHKITLAGDSTGWFAILAIFVVTLLARLITVISTVVQTKSQNKQQKIQPQLAALAKKYPDAQSDPEQKRAMTMEQMQIMKKNKIHPFLPLLFVIIQFPLFICVWSALQGSAALAEVKWLGISLTTTVNQCFTNYKNTPGALTGIFIFIFMTIANILSSTTGLWLTTWRNKKFGNQQQLQSSPNGMDQNKTMKYMTYGMLIFVVIMGFQLPTGMGIYWFLGALISIIQSIIMEAVQSKHRHKLALETGDGSELAFLRRSKHHNDVDDKKDKKKSKSDKPLWRK